MPWRGRGWDSTVAAPPALAWFLSTEKAQTRTRAAPVPNFLLSGACSRAYTHADIIQIHPRGGSCSLKTPFFPLRRYSFDLRWEVRDRQGIKERWDPEAWLPIPALLLSSWVTLSKS